VWVVEVIMTRNGQAYNIMNELWS